jgi:hypothetical protein
MDLGLQAGDVDLPLRSLGEFFRLIVSHFLSELIFKI